jgi:hypothetical protein
VHRTERDSHPVGTTVKVTNFFQSAPVRKQTALKNPAKCLTKIKSLIQAYALARPTIRFRLHVLRAKSNKNDFIYAPKATANVEDAVLKIMGKDCALRCDWTALASDGFEMHAYLPKPTAIGSKVANFGGFISIDNRPMSTSRGTLKKLVSTFKNKFSKANPSFSGVKDPFFFLNVLCPPDSYDPNIEPAKDDVLFEDCDAVVALFDKLLVCYYPEVVVDTEVTLDDGGVDVSESPLPSQKSQETHSEDAVPREDISSRSCDLEVSGESDEIRLGLQNEKPQWVSSMYDIDEDGLDVTQDDRYPEIEEEEELRAAAISNPWTIARMNAPLKPKRPIPNGQLLSPAKSLVSQPSSPAPITTNQALPVTLSTPSSSQNTNRFLLGQSLQRSDRVELSPSADYRSVENNMSQPVRPPQCHAASPPFGINTLGRLGQRAYEPSGSVPVDTLLNSRSGEQREASPDPLNSNLPSVTPEGRRRKVQNKPYKNRQFVSPVDQPNDTWFGQPMRGAQPANSSRTQKQKRKQEAPILSRHNAHSSPTPVPAENRLHCTSNNDIRAFFSQNRGPRNHNASTIPSTEPQNHIDLPFTDIPTSPSPADITAQLIAYAEREAQALQDPSTIPTAVQCSPVSPIPQPQPQQPPSRPRHRNSTLHRTPSSNLPLERILRSDATHKLVQHLGVSNALIARLAKTQSKNGQGEGEKSTGWMTPAGEAYPGFDLSSSSSSSSRSGEERSVSPGRLTQWVCKLETLLCARELGGKVAGVDVRGVLRAGVLRGIEGREPGVGNEVVDLCADADADGGVDADMAVPSVECVKVEDGEGDDEMLMDL